MTDIDQDAVEIRDHLAKRADEARKRGDFAEEYELLGRLNSFMERAGL